MNAPPISVAHLWDAHGILLRRDAVASGIDDNALARLVRGKMLIRLRHGAYCRRSTYLAADDLERHRLLCRAVMRQYGEHVALSHGSSCIAQGGPDWGLDLGSAHLTHLDGSTGRKQSKLVHHTGVCRVGDVRRQDGHWVTTPARAILETACLAGVEAGLVQANHFLHTGAVTKGQLAEVYAAQNRWPDSLIHHPILLLADGLTESVGEARSIYAMWTQGLPMPELQHEVRHPSGAVAARLDFAWPGLKVAVEFDGLVKYHRHRRPGEGIEDMVMREKRREDLVRELTGWTVIRITWADLANPIQLAARIRRAFSVSRHSR